MTAAAVEVDYPPAFVEPAHLWVPPGRRGTYGPEIVDFAASIGHGVDPEQAASLDVLSSYGPGGSYLTLETVDIEGRQQGKTDRVELIRALADLFLFRAPMITWTAHQLDTCLATFGTVKRLIDSNESLSRRVKAIREQRTEWSVELMPRNGVSATMEFRSRAGGGGRGRTGDIWHVDEAGFVSPTTMGDRLPTLSSRPNPQVRYSASAAFAAHSAHLRTLVRRGRAMNDPTLIYLEYCAPGSFKEPGCVRGVECSHRMGTPGCVGDEESLWHLANHSLGRRTAYTFLRAERRTLEPTEWLRERFGWHEDGPEDDTDPPIPLDALGRCVDPAARIDSRPIFSLDVELDRGSAVIWAAGYGDDDPRLPTLELVDLRPGTDWVVGRFRALRERHRSVRVVVNDSGPAGSMILELQRIGCRVVPMNAGNYAKACGAFYDMTAAASGPRWRYPGPVAELDGADPLADAVRGAKWRTLGDARAWDRRNATSTTCPLVGATGALWGLLMRPGIPRAAKS